MNSVKRKIDYAKGVTAHAIRHCLRNGPPKSHLELSEAFRELDADADGYIDLAGYACLLSTMHVPMSHPQILAAFREIDRDGNRIIDFREFLHWWRTAEVN